MFGFGKSQLEKVLLSRAIETLKPFGLESEAQSVLDQAKQAALSLTSNLESVNLGDSIIRNIDYVKVREAEGLSKEEIRDYWNKGVFIRCLDNTIRELFQFLNANVAEMEGRDPVEASREFHKVVARYGNPKSFDKHLPVYLGLSESDAPIPVELSDRVQKWESRISPSVKENMLGEFTTYNAMIRHLIAKGQL